MIVDLRKLALIAGAMLAPFAAYALGPGDKPAMTNDYPTESLKAGEQGTVFFEAEIDETGKVKACRITQSSGFKRLDDATCALIARRARFTPAHDQQGNPTTGLYRNKIVWKLPPPGS